MVSPSFLPMDEGYACMFSSLKRIASICTVCDLE